MSGSSPFSMLEIGPSGVPRIDASQFNLILDAYGINVVWRKYAEVKDCPCYDSYALQANPDCPVCKGSGQVDLGWQDEVILAIVLYNTPNGYWSLGDIQTRIGNFEREEANVYVSSRSNIKIKDMILVNPNPSYETAEYDELHVYNRMPRFVGDGTGNRILIFTRLDARLSPYAVTGGSPP